MWIPKEKPSYVYKYCSAQRAVQLLRDLTFHFAPAAQLNDLYEFRARSLYREDVDSKYRVFAKRLVSEGWWSTFDEALEATKSLSFGLTDKETRWIGNGLLIVQGGGKSDDSDS